jgi:hypothetical protein
MYDSALVSRDEGGNADDSMRGGDGGKRELGSWESVVSSCCSFH